MSTTTPPQEAAVRDLVTAGVLTTGQADAVLAALPEATAPPGRQRGWRAEILGYVGGGLMLAGAATLVGLSWHDLTRAGKVALLGVVLLVLLDVTVAVPEAVWGLTDGAGGAAAILLIAGAVLLGASGAGLWLHRSRPAPGTHAPSGGQP